MLQDWWFNSKYRFVIWLGWDRGESYVNDIWPWPISQGHLLKTLLKKKGTTKSCPHHNFPLQGSFSYLVQVFTTKWGYAVHNEFWPWSISSWSFAHEFAVLEILKFCLHTIVPAIGGMLYILLTLQSAQGFAKKWDFGLYSNFPFVRGIFFILGSHIW